jgi:hypothetical protein
LEPIHRGFDMGCLYFYIFTENLTILFFSSR